MSTTRVKQLALSTQLKNALISIAELEKKLKDKTGSYDNTYLVRIKLEEEIEQMHQILDSVPNPIGRKTEHEESYYRKDRSAVVRFAAWLASRSN